MRSVTQRWITSSRTACPAASAVKKVVIGSQHFVFEDEGCVLPAGEQARFDALPGEYSHLYLGISGVLAAVICIEDPLRSEARGVIDALHAQGIPRLAS